MRFMSKYQIGYFMIHEPILIDMEDMLKSNIKIDGSNLKEKGHSGASGMEGQVIKILSNKYKIEAPEGIRSHEDGNIFTPEHNIFNVKYGFKLGQPNMCSIKRLIDLLDNGIFDSYYIIWIKQIDKSISVKIFDIFSNLDYLTYNAGPGQIMLKEKNFYNNIINVKRNCNIFSPSERKNILMKMMYDSIKKTYNLRMNYLKKKGFKDFI